MGEVSPAFCSWKTSAPSGLMKVFFAFSLWSFTYATFAAAASSKGSSTSNLSSLLAPEIKFVFVGGKGGVGKTTTSSGLATQLAKDQRILLVSTDPAHSQSDAWAPQQFSNVPKAVEGLKNLDIVELSPKDSLQKEIDSWDELASDEPQVRDFIEKAQDTMKGLQGIDEAIALSEAYDYIHSGAYDKVVFDTAPTGHTLRLLDLPAMMSKALETIRDMQSNLLNLVDMASSIFGAQGSVGTGMSPAFKEVITAKLEQYQEKVDRVASMLSNERATRFVVVCIAEYLSISETKRLLSELKSRRVTASHVVVNQLVDQDLVISSDERDDVVAALETKNSGLSDKVVGALEVFRSKAAIQQKYLKTLKESDEVRQGASTNSTSGIAVVEVPLLASEVVGVNALKTFSRLLLQNPAEVREITRNWNRSKQTPDTPSVKKESAKKAAVKIATKAAAKGESKKTKKTKKKYKKITEEMVEQKTRMLIADMFMNEKMPDLKKWEPILKKDSMLLAQTMQGSPDFLKKAENCKDMEDVSACIDELMKDPIAKTLLREVARAELAEEAVEPVDEYAGSQASGRGVRLCEASGRRDRFYGFVEGDVRRK
ncbi:unnamed protein product [Amoebophrya sp. A25]|nr:unnamed protein product [Amoebophrya sp. A25]|eukprot:GSA25T00013064001.1